MQESFLRMADRVHLEARRVGAAAPDAALVLPVEVGRKHGMEGVQ